MVSPVENPIDSAFRRFVAERRPEDLGFVFEGAAPELLALGRCLRLDEELAQDALQETFLVVLRRLREFDATREFMPWATGIFLRSAQSIRRRRKQRAPRATDLHSRGNPRPDELLEAREVLDAVHSAVEQLPATYRDVIRETLHDGAGPKELAQRHGISANAAALRVHRGMRVLRQTLAPVALAFIFSASANASSIELTWPRVAARAARLKWITLSQVAALLFVLVGALGLISALQGDAIEPNELDGLPATPMAQSIELPAEERLASRVEIAGSTTSEASEAIPRTRPGRLLTSQGSGAPAGVEIQLLWTDSQGGYLPLNEAPRVVAVTQEDGWLEMPVDLGASADRRPLLFAAHDGRVAWTKIHDTDSDESIQLDLQPAGHLAITVTDTFDEPIAGARVTALPVFLPFAPFPTPISSKRGFVEADDSRFLFEARTDSLGQATLDFLPVQAMPTPVALRVESDEFLSHMEIAGFQGPGEAKVHVQLVQDIELAGVVIDENGAAVANAEISADWRGHLPDTREVLARSDENGEFVLGVEQLAAFPVNLRIRANGHADGQHSVFSPHELSFELVRIQVPRVSPLIGFVFDENATPVAGARVRFANADAIHEVESDAAGQFTIDGLRPGPGDLWASPPPALLGALFDSPRYVLSEEQGAPLLVLSSRPSHGASVRVHTIDASSGEPLTPARASLHPWDVAGVDSPWPASEVRLERGGVQVRDLPAGKWILFLDAGEARMGYTEIEVGTDGSHTSEVKLGEAGSLECHLPDVEGGWLYVHARLMLPIRPPGWFDLGDGLLRRYARTDNPGDVTSFVSLFPGTWQVSAANSRQFGELSGVELRPGETRAVELEAEPSAVLHLEYAAPETSVRILLELSTDQRPEWTKRHDMLIQPNETPRMPLPIPTGRVRWRARYLHPLVRITEAEIYFRQEGEVLANQGSQVRAFLAFERTR